MFDVSSNVMFIGYSKNKELVDYSIRIAQKDHAKYLVDRISQVLQRNKIKLTDLDEIIVGIGPGSYTGLRVAIMVAKMLGYTKKIPVKTISSLFFMTSGYEQKTAALIDARRGYFFTLIHDKEKIILKDTYIKYEELKALPDYKDSQAILISDRDYKVSAKLVIEQAVLVDDIHGLVPNYLRRTEAERNYDQKSDS